MLELDADKRMTAEKALAHPYLAQYADPTDEPNSPSYDQSFEDMELNVERWKGNILKIKCMLIDITLCIIDIVELVWEEVVNYVPSTQLGVL